MRSSRPMLATSMLGLVLGVVLGLASGCASGPPPTPTDLGNRALAEGDWRTAKGHFAEALRLEATNGSAWLGQAQAQLAGRDAEATLRSLSSLAKVDPERFRVDAQGVYADGLEAAVGQRLDRNQSESALQAVRALVKLEPKRSGLSRLLGLSMVREADRLRLMGDREAALSLYREACRVTPLELDAWVGAAEILLEKRKRKQAVRLLEMARKSHPTAGAIRMLTLQAMRIR